MKRIWKMTKKKPNVIKAIRALLGLCVLLCILIVLLVAYGKIPGVLAFFSLMVGLIVVIICFNVTLMLMRTIEKLKASLQAQEDLEGLNRTLRSDRHDFKNHLQVICALLEMQEYEEAQKYMTKVNSDLQRVGKALRTNQPAVNALLEAKRVLCQEKNIQITLDIYSTLDDLPIESWEFCRILGNLTDNAIDATQAWEQPQVTIILRDVNNGFLLRVVNTGETVPQETSDLLFSKDFSTKGAGRGLGLAIVRQILEQCGGSVVFHSDRNITTFEVFLPKARSAQTDFATS